MNRAVPLTALGLLTLLVGVLAVQDTARSATPLPWDDHRVDVSSGLPLADTQRAARAFRQPFESEPSCRKIAFHAVRASLDSTFRPEADGYGDTKPFYVVCERGGSVEFGFGLGLGRQVYAGPGFLGEGRWTSPSGSRAYERAMPSHLAAEVFEALGGWNDMSDLDVMRDDVYVARMGRVEYFGWAALGADLHGWWPLDVTSDGRMACTAIRRLRSRAIDAKGWTVLGCFDRPGAAEPIRLNGVYIWTAHRTYVALTDVRVSRFDRTEAVEFATRLGLKRG